MRLTPDYFRFLLAAMITLPALAAAPATPKAELDEVTVSGERVKIEALRKQIVQLEDTFYDRYNELNTVDDFDIHCIEEARTGTRFIKRSCRAVYQEQALADEGQAAFKILQRFREKGPPIADSGRRYRPRRHRAAPAGVQEEPGRSGSQESGTVAGCWKSAAS